MGKIIAIIVIALAVWFIYNGTIDVNKGSEKIKNSSMELLKKDNTFNKINKNRELNENAINNYAK